MVIKTSVVKKGKNMKNLRYIVIGLAMPYFAHCVDLTDTVQVKNNTKEILQVAILRAQGSDKLLLTSDDVAKIDIKTVQPNGIVYVRRPFVKVGVDRYIAVADTDTKLGFGRKFVGGIKGLYSRQNDSLELDNLHSKFSGTFAIAAAGYTNGSKFTATRVGNELVIRPGIS